MTAPCFAAGAAAQPAGDKTAQTAPLTKEDRERAELRTKTYKALLDLYKRKPQSRKAIQNAFGYAVFVDTSYSVGLLGGGHGRGRAINQHSGREVFMKMGEMKVGLGLGVRQSNIIFVFGNEDAFNSFITKDGLLVVKRWLLPETGSMETPWKAPSRWHRACGCTR